MDATHLIVNLPTPALTVLDKYSSPNFDQRSLPVSMLVLHYTGMQSAELALDRLCDPKAKVSSHYLVTEQGEVFQLVADEHRAWHAGIANWRGITDINSASIGVEIVNGGHDFGLPEFPSPQIAAVIALCQDILQRHIISAADIVGHNEIAPARKLDPGEKFPWQQLAEDGIGLWPDQTRSTAQTPSEQDAKQLLAKLGYDVNSNKISGTSQQCIMSEFQRRYRPEQVDGILDPSSWRLMQNLFTLHQDLTNLHKTD